jgi:hypothetical protein
MSRPKVMGRRAARKWLFSYAADLLHNFESSDPITERLREHDGDADAAERETFVLQSELPWVVAQLKKRGSW